MPRAHDPKDGHLEKALLPSAGMRRAALLFVTLSAATLTAQAPSTGNSAVEEETLRHFQALLRFDTSDPPGAEKPAVEYLKQVLDREGIANEVFALEPDRPNL